MTRYFFNIRDGAAYYPDEEGSELVNLAAALDEAELCSRELVASLTLRGKSHGELQFEIVVEGELAAKIVSFDQAMRLST